MSPDAGDDESGRNHTSLSVKIVLSLAIFVVGFNFISRCWFCFCRSVTSSTASSTSSARAVSSEASSSDRASATLDREMLLATLPAFTYSESEQGNKLECAVCLMDFKNGEKGRFLSICLHRFHADCIDTWFLSHSTCPLCRSTLQLPV